MDMDIFGTSLSGLGSSVSDWFKSSFEGTEEKNYKADFPEPTAPGPNATLAERDDYDQAMDSWRNGLEEAKAQDAESRAKKLKELGKEGFPGPGDQQVIAGPQGAGPVKISTSQPQYGMIKSPYNIVERGMDVTDINKLISETLRTMANLRVTRAKGRAITGLLG